MRGDLCLMVIGSCAVVTTFSVVRVHMRRDASGFVVELVEVRVENSLTEAPMDGHVKYRAIRFLVDSGTDGPSAGLVGYGIILQTQRMPLT